MSRDKKRHGALNGRITCHVINSGWTGNLLAILNHTSDMKAQGFCRSAPRFFQSSTSRNAPRKIWEAHAKIRFTILMQICDVIHQFPQPNACLLFYVSQLANCYISNRMWHSDASRLHRMFELFVAPTCATSYQPSCCKRCMTSRLDIRYDTHFLHTYQVGVYWTCI